MQAASNLFASSTRQIVRSFRTRIKPKITSPPHAPKECARCIVDPKIGNRCFRLKPVIERCKHCAAQNGSCLPVRSCTPHTSPRTDDVGHGYTLTNCGKSNIIYSPEFWWFMLETSLWRLRQFIDSGKLSSVWYFPTWSHMDQGTGMKNHKQNHQIRINFLDWFLFPSLHLSHQIARGKKK